MCSPSYVMNNLRCGEEASTSTSTGKNEVFSHTPATIINLNLEYTVAVQSNSYAQMWSIIHPNSPHTQHLESLISQLLHPTPNRVQETLHQNPTTLTSLLSAYFDHTESVSHRCLQLHSTLYQTRSLYAPLRDLLFSDLPDSPQCDKVLDIFLQFDTRENPFPINAFHDVQRGFSQLKHQLDKHLRKSRSRVRFIRRSITGSAICFTTLAVGAAASALVLAAHSLVFLTVSAPLFSWSGFRLPCSLIRKEIAKKRQLEVAAMGTYVLINDLSTMERLVSRFHDYVEADKLLVRMGLERGKDKYSIQEVTKLLHKNYINLHHQLHDLETHLCLCFVTVNRARSLLLQQIHIPQTS